ncbi:MAG: SpoIIIAH-like family protein [Limnochordaceae bacterium]|nr:SpoIIIAH-like family protein [Limnochordaceae bacterium]
MFLVIERWITRSVLAIVVVGILALAYWWGSSTPAVPPPSPSYQPVSGTPAAQEPTTTSLSPATGSSPAATGAATSPQTASNGTAGKNATSQEGRQETGQAAVPALGQLDFFARYRMDRERARSQQLDLYQKMVGDQSLTPASRQEAQQALLALASGQERETDIENLLRAKGFQDALVILDNRGATVVIPDQEMTPEKAAQIGELVHRVAGTPLDEISILPVGV